MFDEGAALGVVLAIAAASFLGVSTSRFATETSRHSLRVECLTGLSAGVLIAVAWLHLLDDAQERVEGLTDYPAVNAAMLTGYMLMATVEALTSSRCHHSRAAGVPLLPTAGSPTNKHGSAHQLRMFHVLEASISLHSVLIGLGFGLGELAAQEQVVLGLALCVHQFLEGLSVGMLGKRSGLSRSGWRCTFCVFTLSLPLGVAAGVTTRHLYAGFDNSLAFRWTSGLLNALAAGTLTHIGVHMLAEHVEAPTPLAAAAAVHAGRVESPDSVSIVLEPGDASAVPEALPKSCADAECCSTRDQALRAMIGDRDEGLTRRCAPPPGILKMMAACLGAALMAVLAIWA